MVKYSGRTTAYEHKFDNWKDVDVSTIPYALNSQIVFEVQWSDCPIEVADEVKRLWKDITLGNDYFYFSWISSEYGEDYPIINEYLLSNNVEECLIHWWW